MTHRQILEAMTGLLAALFTAMLSSTIVSVALPTIIGDLAGTQRQYTWVITAALLATTVSTPIWGKLADLFDKKRLVQVAIVIFVAGSVAAGFAQTVPFLLAMRVVQGLGMGGLTALVQAIMGTIIAPRERGRYAGYMGSVMAVSTVSGPLLGGLLVDTALGWRWCFFVCVPLAVISLFVIQATLKVFDVGRTQPKIDYLGAVLLAGTASLPMLWVTFAGNDFGWWSWQTAAFLGSTVVLLAITVWWELRAPEPLVPIRLLANRTAILVIVASVSVGIGMFGGTTFLGQYFQLARGYSPTHAGLLTIPLMAALLLSSTLCGQLVSRTGRFKRFLVGGAVSLTAGLAVLGSIDHTTPIWFITIGMALMGLGVGAMMQNLVLAVQNTVDVKDIGSTSASVAFFRSLGGALGVSVLGAVLADHVQKLIVDGLAALGISGSGSAPASLDLSNLPAPVVQIIRGAYGDATGLIFLIGAGAALVSLIAVALIKEVPLRSTISLKTPGHAGRLCAAGEARRGADQRRRRPTSRRRPRRPPATRAAPRSGRSSSLERPVRRCRRRVGSGDALVSTTVRSTPLTNFGRVVGGELGGQPDGLRDRHRVRHGRVVDLEHRDPHDRPVHPGQPLQAPAVGQGQHDPGVDGVAVGADPLDQRGGEVTHRRLGVGRPLGQRGQHVDCPAGRPRTRCRGRACGPWSGCCCGWCAWSYGSSLLDPAQEPTRPR